MSKKSVGAYLKLDNETGFVKSVTSCNKALSAMKSEIKLVKEEESGHANTLESLSKKQDVLKKALGEYEKKQEEVSKGLKHAQDDYKKIGDGLQSYHEQLEQAEEALRDMESSGEASEKELKKQKELVKELSDRVEKGTEVYRKSGDRVKDWENKLNNAKLETRQLSKELDENTEYMKEAEAAADGCAVSIDEYGNKVKDAANDTKELKDTTQKFITEERITSVLESIASGAESLLSNAYKSAIELDEGYDTVITKTGATGKALEELNDVADRVFTEMPVSMSEVGTAVGEVNTRFAQTGKILEDTSKNFLQFSEINGTDVNESIDATDRIMDQFNISAEQMGGLLGLLTKRGQETGISVSGLMSELDGNAATFKELNMDVAESANLLATLEANGVDTGTAIKGLKTAVNDYAKEGKSAREGLEETIKSIRNAESSTQALAIAQEVFGSKGAQAMADGIRDGRISLDSLSDSLSNYETTVEDTYMSTLDAWDNVTIATNNMKKAGSELAGECLSTLMPAVNKVTGVVQSLTKGYSEMGQPQKRIISGLIGAAAAAGVLAPKAYKLYLAIAGIKKLNGTASVLNEISKATKKLTGVTETATAAEAVKTGVMESGTTATVEDTAATTSKTVATEVGTIATEKATIAQAAFNSVLSANPATIAIVGLSVLTGALVVLGSKIDETEDKVGELQDSVDESVSEIKDTMKELEESVGSCEDSIAEIGTKTAVADNLITELFELQTQTKKSDDELARMSLIVDELNEMYPEMSLKLDKNTGSLSKNEAQARASIETARKLAEVQAYQKELAEIAEDMVAADMSRMDAEKNLDDITEQLNVSQKEKKRIEEACAKAARDGTTVMVDYNGQLIESQEALQQVVRDEEELLQAKARQEDQTEKLNGKYEEANERYTEVYERMEEVTDSTKENTEAIRENTDASKANQEAAATSIETAGMELEAYRSLSAEQQNMAVSVTNSVITMKENVQSALQSQMNMFEEFNGGVEISKETLLSNMQSQIEGVTQWEQQLSSLAEKGVNEGILQKLAEMGPEGSGYVSAFAQMTTEEINQANEMWSTSVDMKSVTDEWGTQLLEYGAESIAGGVEGLQPLLQQSGANTVIGFVNGMQDAQRMAEEAGTDIGVKTIDNINEGLGCQSPSKKTKESGKNVGEGLIQGIRVKKSTVKVAAGELSEGVITKISSELTAARFKTYGFNVSSGLANGIRLGKSEVINAVSELCGDAIKEAKTKLEINSPSKVFMRFGEGTAEGFGIGYERKIKDVRNLIRESMSYSEGSMNVGASAYNGSGAGNITFEIPVYINGVYNRTSIQEISMDGLAGELSMNYRQKGLRINVG